MIVGTRVPVLYYQFIRGAADGLTPGQGQVLDVGSKRVGCRRTQNRIGIRRSKPIPIQRIQSIVVIFDHHVAGVVYNVGVIANATDQCVRTGPAIKNIMAVVITADNIVQLIAGTSESTKAPVPGAGVQGQVLHIGPKRVRDRCLDRIDPFTPVLYDHIAAVVDYVVVIAGSAGKCVNAGVAGQHVVKLIAGAADGVTAGQRQAFNVCRKRVAYRTPDRIVAFLRIFYDYITRAADYIGVVARSTGEHVVSTVAGQHVVQLVAGAAYGLTPGQGQVLDVGSKRVGCRRTQNRIGIRRSKPIPIQRIQSIVVIFDHHVAGVVYNVGVIANATDQCVRTGPAIKNIMAVVITADNIVQLIAGTSESTKAPVPGAGVQGQVLHIGPKRVRGRCLDRIDPFSRFLY